MFWAMNKVKVKPLNRDMTNLVKQHGEVWNRLVPIALCAANEAIIETTVMVHCNGTQPYICWIVTGVDCELENIE